MQWKHKTNLNWLKARQQFLTATDIKELIPVTKTGRPRTISSKDYLKVLARKRIGLTDTDTLSTGAAARGHLLEPYAIAALNQSLGHEAFYHWDDIVICGENENSCLAFSPDGMNVKMPNRVQNNIMINKNATRIIEVKSYGPELHIEKGNTNKQQLEERWQIATAFCVSPLLESATLIFYNPNLAPNIYGFNFKPIELYDEMQMIYEVVDNWKTFLNNPMQSMSDFVCPSHMSEEEIIKDIEEKQQFNP